MTSRHRARLAPFDFKICGLDELPWHREAGISHVLSLLDPEMPDPVVVSSYEDLQCHWVLRFNDIVEPMQGARAPESDDVAEILSFGRELSAAKGPVNLLVHCHAGVSRSTAAAVILIAQHQPGWERDAVAEVVTCRPIAQPNMRMITLADSILGRRGALIRAVSAI